MANHNNKEWLYNKYINEKLSQTEIAKLCNVSRWTINDKLEKNNIQKRTISESVYIKRANHCNLSQEAIEWINGELLGDGCLTTTEKRGRKSYNVSALFRYGSKYKEYIEYIAKTLDSFGIKQSGKIIEYYNKRQNTYCYKYNSHSYKELFDIYKKWYPNGKKIVPKDIELTPLTCRQWYIGDGSLIQRGNRNIKPFIVLCTMGFLFEDVNRLISKLNNLGLKATRYTKNTIYISAYSIKSFLNYIKKCPIDCYQYKWAI